MKKFFTLIAMALTTVGAMAADVVPTSTHKVAQSEIWWTTASNVASANAGGWCSANTNGSNNKSGDITVSLDGDVTGESVKLDGVLAKWNNTPSDMTTSKKALAFRITGADEIHAYGATTSSSAAAGFRWKIVSKTEGVESPVPDFVNGAVADPGKSATISCTTLNKDAEYVVYISGGVKDDGTSGQDMVVYAVKMITSNVATNEAPTVAIPASVQTVVGYPVDLNAAVTGFPEPTLQWYDQNGAIEGATTAKLTVTPEAAGTYNYYCVATNSVGSEQSEMCAVEVLGDIVVEGETYLVNGEDKYISTRRIVVNNGSMTLGDDGNSWATGEDAKEIDGVAVTHRLNGQGNPSAITDNAPAKGTAYKFVTAINGWLTVYANVNSGKELYFVENGALVSAEVNGEVVESKSKLAEAVAAPIKMACTAGSTYYVYCTGSKLAIYGFSITAEKTAISTVNTEAQNNVMYNIAGQRVSNAKGLVIVNGKKVVK